MVDYRNMLVEDLVMSQLQSEKEITDHVLLIQTVYSRKIQIAVEKNLPQIVTCRLAQLKLFHVAEKMFHARQTFKINHGR